MKWATRKHCHVDRAACGWLIRRFIDPEPTFIFVDDPTEVDADATAFDMRGVQLSHHAGDCSFETMLQHFNLADPALWDLARIVHEADLDDERYLAPEGRGVDVVMRGLSMVADDDEVLAVSARVFDGLYEYCRQAILKGKPPT
jgi:hypothetical protein